MWPLNRKIFDLGLKCDERKVWDGKFRFEKYHRRLNLIDFFWITLKKIIFIKKAHICYTNLYDPSIKHLLKHKNAHFQQINCSPKIELCASHKLCGSTTSSRVTVTHTSSSDQLKDIVLWKFIQISERIFKSELSGSSTSKLKELMFGLLWVGKVYKEDEIVEVYSLYW